VEIRTSRLLRSGKAHWEEKNVRAPRGTRRTNVSMLMIFMVPALSISIRASERRRSEDRTRTEGVQPCVANGPS